MQKTPPLVPNTVFLCKTQVDGRVHLIASQRNTAAYPVLTYHWLRDLDHGKWISNYLVANQCHFPIERGNCGNCGCLNKMPSSKTHHPKMLDVMPIVICVAGPAPCFDLCIHRVASVVASLHPGSLLGTNPNHTLPNTNNCWFFLLVLSSSRYVKKGVIDERHAGQNDKKTNG